MKLFGSSEIINGVLHIGGISVEKLREEYGTPLYIMDQKLIEDNMKKYKEYFVSEKFKTQVIYATKAFLNIGMCQLVNKFGLGVDAVSDGELFTIKHSGFPMENVYMHGNNKSDLELEMCIDYGVGTIIVDSFSELKKLEEICRIKKEKVKALLRVNPGIEAHTHEYIKTSKDSSKFGETIYEDKIYDIIKEFQKSEDVELLGFHCHIGSQIFDTKAFYEEIETMMKFIETVKEKLNFNTRVLNLGGGFGIYYVQGDKELNIPQIMKKMVEILENKLDEYEISLEKVIIEPGRSIVGNAGTTIYTVGGTKITHSGKKYIFVDGGMADNIRPALYQAEYEGCIANKMNEKTSDEVTVAGKCCESGDMLIKDTFMAEAQAGDILAVATTGAYNYSMASNYNRLKKPAVVLVKDGKSRLLVRRETYEDLIRNDVNFED
mgnify:FL=1